MFGMDPRILLLAAMLGLAGVVLAAYRFRFALVVFAGLLFVSAIGAPLDWEGRLVHTWMLPIQLVRTYLFGAFGGLMIVTLVAHLPRMSFRRTSSQTLWLLAIGVYEAIIRFLTSDVEKGVLTLLLRLLVVLPAAFVLPALLETRRDWLALLRTFMFVSAMWIGASAVQFVTDRSVLTLGAGGLRFQGMLSNPQHAAAFLAYTVVIATFMALNDGILRFRPIWIIAASIGSMLLLWTGSRTGVSMAIIGMMFVLYPRLGVSIILLPIAIGLVLLAFSFIARTGVDFDLSHLISHEDTRSSGWTGLVRTIADHPLFGIGSTESGEAGGSENSILYGTATSGLGMGALILVLMISSAVLLKNLWRLKRSMIPSDRRLVDLIVGANCMYFAGSMFEGYIIARVSAMLVILMMFGAMGSRLIQEAREAPTSELEHDQPPDQYDEWSYGEDADQDYGVV